MRNAALYQLMRGVVANRGDRWWDGRASLDLRFSENRFYLDTPSNVFPGTVSRASGGSYFDAAGVLRWAANNAWRRDYDPVTLAPLGALIEEQRTNLVPRSGDLAHGDWFKVGISVSANVVVAPDGTTTMDKIVEDTSGIHLLYSAALTVVAGTTVTGAFFLKAGERTKGSVRLQGASGQCTATFDLTAGTVVASNTAPAVTAAVGIRPIGGGIYLVWVTGVAGAADTTVGLRLYLHDNSGAGAYTGDGVSGLYAWGAQLEAGAFPTSHIPTVASAVTRAADVVSTALGSWFNPVAGTFFIDAYLPAANGTFLFIANGIGYTNYLRVARLGGVVIFQGAGISNVTVLTIGALPAGSRIKIAIGYGAGATVGCANGGAVGSTSLWVPGTANLLSVGQGAGDVAPINEQVRSVNYYPRRLSNAELQALTV